MTPRGAVGRRRLDVRKLPPFVHVPETPRGYGSDVSQHSASGTTVEPAPVPHRAPKLALAALGLSFAAALVAATGLGTARAAAETRAESSARAASVEHWSGRVGLGAAAFDPNLARLAVAASAAHEAAKEAVAVADGAEGTAPAEQTAALRAAASSLVAEAEAALPGHRFGPRLAEVRSLSDHVTAAVVAWEAAEAERAARVAAEAAAAAEAQGSDETGPGDVGTLPPDVQAAFDAMLQEFLLRPPMLLTPTPPQPTPTYVCRYDDGTVYTSTTLCLNP